MLASITPLGERARGNRWTTTAVLFIAASITAGAAVGAMLGLLGSLILAHVGIGWRLGLLAAALALGVVWELRRGTVPGPRRQVNERWLDHYRRWIYASGFGAQLGRADLSPPRRRPNASGGQFPAARLGRRLRQWRDGVDAPRGRVARGQGVPRGPLAGSRHGPVRLEIDPATAPRRPFPPQK